MNVRTADSSVWSGATAGSTMTYFANDPVYFPFETKDTYNVAIDTSRGGELDQRGGAIGKRKKVRRFGLEFWRQRRSLKTHSRK